MRLAAADQTGMTALRHDADAIYPGNGHDSGHLGGGCGQDQKLGSVIRASVVVHMARANNCDQRMLQASRVWGCGPSHHPATCFFSEAISRSLSAGLPMVARSQVV